MGFLLLEDPQILSDYMFHIYLPSSYTLRVLTFYVKLFKRALFSISKLVHIRKGPFFDFEISPYSFFNVLASFQLTPTGNNKSC